MASIGMKQSDKTSVQLTSHREMLRAGQITQIYDQSSVGSLAASIGVVILAGALWQSESHTALIIWTLFYLAHYAVHRYLVIRFRKIRPTGSATFVWGRLHQMVTLSGGLAWGYATIFLFPDGHEHLQIFMIIFVGGIVAGGVALYTPTNEYLQNIVLALLPLAGNFFYHGGSYNITVGGLLLMYGATMALSGRSIHKTHAELITLRLERQDLIDELKEDIELRKSIERDLIKAHDELELRVELRTAEIAKINEELVREIDERIKAERELRRSHDEIEAILNSTTESAFLINSEGVLLALNDTTARVLGKPREELVGKVIFDHIPSDLARSRRAKFDKVVRTGQADAFEDDNRGSISSLNLFPVLDEDCHVQSVAVFARDITHNRRLEQDLRESEQKYRLLVEKALEGIVVAQDGLLRFANVAALKIVGYDEEEVLFKPFTEFIHPDDRDMVLQRHLRRMKGENFPSRYSFRIIRKDGQNRWVEIDTGPIVWEDKPAVLLFMTDITESKVTQEKILESERRFRLLLEDVSSVPVQGYDVERRVLFWNSASERLYGYSRDEAFGKKLEDLIIPPYMRDEVISAIDNWVRDGQKIPPAELGLMRKDGNIVPVYSTHVMLEDSRGQKEIYCVDLDLTELKRAEEERATLRDQLFLAQKMEAIGNLASGIAHDFNNILQVVLGFSQVMLQQKKEGEADYSRIEKIYNAGKRGAELVKSLMTFSRQTDPLLRACNLNHEILQVQDLLSHTIPKTIRIDLNLSEDLKSIRADRSQLGQILMNLGVNARDAMPDGGTLNIETLNIELDDEYLLEHPEAKPGNHILLTVSDTGQGMEKETLTHAFEPFFTTKEVGKGTGLGLATVYGIVKRHNGHITCDSELGHGTTFKIYFPAINEQDDSRTSVLDSDAPSGTETILLVEDENVVRESCQEILTNFGYEVITACNGKEALEIYRTEGENISLVVLDLIMPEMDGTRCLSEILQISPQAKVIIASGCIENGTERSGPLAGAKNFLSKPYDMEELLRSVRYTLDND